LFAAVALYYLIAPPGGIVRGDFQQSDAGRGLAPRPAALGALPASAKRYALVVGVDRYDDAQIGALEGASNDARALADALKAYAGFPADQVIVLDSEEPADRLPTRGQILRRLSNLASVVPKDGLLLFSFAGHGIERGGQAYLLPSDAQLSGDVDLLEMTAINAAQVRDKIERAGVQQVLMLLDACRSDPMSGRSGGDNVLTEAYRRAFNFDLRNRGVEAFATFYATAVGERAYEFKEKRHGYFTWAVVEGLRGGAADARGEVTLAGLLKFVQEWVPRQVALDIGPGREQRPFAVVEGYRADELVIAMPPRAAKESGDAGASPAAALRPQPERTEADSLHPEDQTAAKSEAGNRPASNKGADGKSVRSGKKSGRVLLLIREGDRAEGGPFLRAFSQKLAALGLSVTAGDELNASDLARITGALRRLQAGDKRAGEAIPFALVVTGDVGLNSLAPFNGLFVAVAEGSLKAIDADTGRTLAVENISGARGFGNTQRQADDSALAAACEKISAAFVEQLAPSAR
jgi:uncharacterized caspase-like protein